VVWRNSLSGLSRLWISCIWILFGVSVAGCTPVDVNLGSHDAGRESSVIPDADAEARELCGEMLCEVGEFCCNASCGICTGPGEVCESAECDTCGDVRCEPGEICCADCDGDSVGCHDGASCPPCPLTCANEACEGTCCDCSRFGEGLGEVCATGICTRELCGYTQCPEEDGTVFCVPGEACCESCGREAYCSPTSICPSSDPADCRPLDCDGTRPGRPTVCPESAEIMGGFFFNGESCVELVPGCPCERDCDHIFRTLAECEEAYAHCLTFRCRQDLTRGIRSRCPEGYYCDFSVSGAWCGTRIAQGICLSRPEICRPPPTLSEERSAVCGCDGRNHRTECLAAQAGTDVFRPVICATPRDPDGDCRETGCRDPQACTLCRRGYICVEGGLRGCPESGFMP